MCCSSAGPCLLSPIPRPSTRVDPLTRQVQSVSRKGHLGPGAQEEPSWLALGPPEVVTDICQCVSQGFGHEEWTLPTQRTQGQHPIFLVIGFDPLGSWPHLLVNPC